MKKLSALAILMAFIMIGFMSCSKDSSSSSPTTWNLDAGSHQVSNDMTITFSAAQTGDGVISSITYTVGPSSQTVTNPTLPWSVDVSAKAGNNVSMTAIGTTTNGSVTITYGGSGGGETVYKEDSGSTSSSK